MLSGRAQLQSYALGYHATPSTYYAEFATSDVAWMRLFNVSTLLSRNALEPPAAFTFHRQIGPYRFYRIPGASAWGYFDVLHYGGKAQGTLRDLRPLLRDAAPRAFARHELIEVVLSDSDAASVRSRSTGAEARSAPGEVTHSEVGSLAYRADVTMTEAGFVMLKVN